MRTPEGLPALSVSTLTKRETVGLSVFLRYAVEVVIDTPVPYSRQDCLVVADALPISRAVSAVQSPLFSKNSALPAVIDCQAINALFASDVIGILVTKSVNVVFLCANDAALSAINISSAPVGEALRVAPWIMV